MLKFDSNYHWLILHHKLHSFPVGLHSSFCHHFDLFAMYIEMMMPMKNRLTPCITPLNRLAFSLESEQVIYVWCCREYECSLIFSHFVRSSDSIELFVEYESVHFANYYVKCLIIFSSEVIYLEGSAIKSFFNSYSIAVKL